MGCIVQICSAVSTTLPEETDQVHFIETLLMPALHLRAVGVMVDSKPDKAKLPPHFKAPLAHNKQGAIPIPQG